MAITSAKSGQILKEECDVPSEPALNAAFIWRST
jgi:hypothetical protein